MKFTRRQALAAMGASALAARGRAADLPIAQGNFKPDDASLKQFQCPEWFRDAKFGMWAHWGPQAVPRQGDWYARKMYESDIMDGTTHKFTGKPSKEYLYHV